MGSFGKTLKELREGKGLSQGDLADALGVKSGKQTVSRWERELAEPALSEIRKIAELLETTVSRLVGESEPEAPEKPDHISIPVSEYNFLLRKAAGLGDEKS